MSSNSVQHTPDENLAQNAAKQAQNIVKKAFLDAEGEGVVHVNGIECCWQISQVLQQNTQTTEQFLLAEEIFAQFATHMLHGRAELATGTIQDQLKAARRFMDTQRAEPIYGELQKKYLAMLQDVVQHWEPLLHNSASPNEQIELLEYLGQEHPPIKNQMEYKLACRYSSSQLVQNLESFSQNFATPTEYMSSLQKALDLLYWKDDHRKFVEHVLYTTAHTYATAQIAQQQDLDDKVMVLLELENSIQYGSIAWQAYDALLRPLHEELNALPLDGEQ